MMRYIKIIAVLLLMINVVGVVQAQKKERAYLKLYYQNTDNSPRLKAELKTRIDKKFYPLVGAELVFSATQDENQVELGTLTTDAEGVALFQPDRAIDQLVSADGKVYFEAAYAGNDTLKKASKEIGIIPLQLKSELESTDSLATISTVCTVQDTVTELKGQTVTLFIKRLFGLQKIAETELNSRGKATFEVPLPIVSATSQVDFVVAIDNDDFGTLKASNALQLTAPASTPVEENSHNGRKYLLFMILSGIASYLFALFLTRFIHN